jgi:Flp pilus assembly pilin Flp
MTARPVAPQPRTPVRTSAVRDEGGSLITEYGLLAVVAATVAGVLIQWATGGAIVNLFNVLVDRARELVGA